MTLIDAELDLLEELDTRLQIGGERRHASSGKTFVVMDPATGLPLIEVADASPEDAVAALASADAAQSGWRAVSPNERSEILQRAFEQITAPLFSFSQFHSRYSSL